MVGRGCLFLGEGKPTSSALGIFARKFGPQALGPPFFNFLVGLHSSASGEGIVNQCETVEPNWSNLISSEMYCFTQ